MKKEFTKICHNELCKKEFKTRDKRRVNCSRQCSRESEKQYKKIYAESEKGREVQKKCRQKKKQKHEHLRWVHGNPVYGVHVCKHCGEEYWGNEGYCDFKKIKEMEKKCQPKQ